MDTIRVGGKILDVSTPCVMGIANVTPDSFYDGGKSKDLDSIMLRIQEMIDQGAQIIDIGGFSSRPNAQMISVEEEINRIKPIVAEVASQFPKTILSIDTYRSEVVSTISKITSFIVNDITGFSRDIQLIDTVAQLKLPYILMHMQGIPENMQENPNYENICFEILDFMSLKIRKLKNAGINQLILDPGFGFGKTVSHNFELLKKLNLFNIYDCPLLVGLSRKSMIFKTLKSSAEEALNGTTALHMIALNNGAKILRAHDVKEAVESITLHQELTKH